MRPLRQWQADRRVPVRYVWAQGGKIWCQSNTNIGRSGRDKKNFIVTGFFRLICYMNADSFLVESRPAGLAEYLYWGIRNRNDCRRMGRIEEGDWVRDRTFSGVWTKRVGHFDSKWEKKTKTYSGSSTNVIDNFYNSVIFSKLLSKIKFFNIMNVESILSYNSMPVATDYYTCVC